LLCIISCAAWQLREKAGTLFHVYRFLEAHNSAYRGSAAFLPEDGCAEYLQRLQQLFSSGSLGSVA
jgi:hypothetical protein